MSDCNRRRLHPAATIIEKFAHDRDTGVKVVADICGIDRSQVYRWMYGKEFGGTDGTIPQRHHRKIIAAAKAKEIRLSLDELTGLEAAA